MKFLTHAVAYADSAFFDLFTFELKAGTFSALHDKSQIFISDELARKYFDTEEVVGRQITQINNGRIKRIYNWWCIRSSTAQFKFCF